MMKKILVLAIAAAATLFAVSSCTKEEKINVIDAEGLTINPSKLTLKQYDFAELKAVITPENATSKAVKWETKDKSIAIVSNQGLVEAMKPGTVTITATTNDGNYTAECVVTVNAIAVTGITLDKESVEVVEDESITLTATVAPEKATDKTVTWKSSNETVAIVDASGKVTGKSMGTANITATTKDGGKTATCKVTVKVREPKEVEQVEIWKTDVAGYRAILGDATDKTAGFLKYNAKDKVVTWDANTTGKPRTATIEFTNGSKLTVTQIEPKDFAGAWTFTGKTFAPNTKLGVAAGNTTKKDVTIAVKDGQTAKDGSKDIKNNLTIAGLINTYVAEAAADIDYDAKKLRIGIFFDGEKAQAVNTGKDGFGYIALLPELGNGWGSYNFCPIPFNNETNKGWLWLVTDDFGSMHYGKSDWIKCDGKDILGLAFCACKSATPKAADFASVNVAGGYDVIWQCNTGGANDPGFALARK